MLNLYEDLVVKYAKNFIPVKVPEDKVAAIRLLVDAIVAQKQKEDIHATDHRSESKRFFTGLMGEAALEELLHIDIIEWQAGDSIKYSHPDIKELGVGIKTVERDKFPIIFKNNKYPQIICIVSNKIKDVVFVCGLATPAVLNRYQSDRLVLDDRLLARGTKTAFYGFGNLVRIESVEDIKNT